MGGSFAKPIYFPTYILCSNFVDIVPVNPGLSRSRLLLVGVVPVGLQRTLVGLCPGLSKTPAFASLVDTVQQTMAACKPLNIPVGRII